MEKKTKQQIVGAIFLLGLAAIFFPVVFTHPLPLTAGEHLETHIPTPPSLPSLDLKTPQPMTSRTVDNHLSEAWVVQLAAFSSGANADRLVKRLRKKGYNAYVEEKRVFVGPEVHREQIQSIQQELQKNFKLKGIVKKYKMEVAS